MTPTNFKAKLSKINDFTILQLPKNISAKFPSRGLCMAEGTINKHHIIVPLEPDGKGSHWFEIDAKMQKSTRAKAGDTVALALEPTEDWPEPKVPADLKKALEADHHAMELWLDCTTRARWDWIRWIRSTKNPDTRQIRIEKTFSKLKSGKRSPCCFNRSACTEMAVSHNGVLLEI